MNVQLVGSRPPLETGMPKKGMWVFAAPPKTGKSRLAVSFPGSYVLELEKGGGDRLAGRFHEIDSINQFREVFLAATEDPSVQTLVVDTVDILVDWLEQEIAADKNLASIRETAKGVNTFDLWKELKARVIGFIGACKDSGKLVILIAHYKPSKTDREGTVTSAAGIEVPGQIGSYILGQADVVGFMTKRPVGGKNEYYIDFQGGPLVTAGSRVDEINDRKLGPIPKENGFSAIKAAFAEAAPAPAAPVKTKPAKTAAK